MNKDFWNERAALGQDAGTRDLIAKELEIEAIAKYVTDGMCILDAGCGNGITAIELARRFDVKVYAFDLAEKMIEAAETALKGQELKGSVYFFVADILTISQISRRFDLIYTERALVNLPDWPTQKQAIADIIDLLDDNGLFVMCENSQTGLNKINFLRRRIGLSEIEVPWHDLYLYDRELRAIPGFMGIDCYSSTYYFLSRIVNAYLAEGKEPDYDAPVNLLALKLPAMMGDFGQGKIWLYRKENESTDTNSN